MDREAVLSDGRDNTSSTLRRVRGSATSRATQAAQAGGLGAQRLEGQHKQHNQAGARLSIDSGNASQRDTKTEIELVLASGPE